MSHSEMTIPQSRRDFLWASFQIFTVVVFGVLALLNLANREAIIPSAIWILFVGSVLRSGCRNAGGIEQYLREWLAAFAGRNFVVSAIDKLDQVSIRFGYEMFGRRIYQKNIVVDQIESIEWWPGQATSMAGRDLKDWTVVLWYRRDDLEKTRKRHNFRKPDQNLHIIGPPRSKEVTAALGEDVLFFLSEAGLTFVPGETENVFNRETSGKNN